MQQEISLHTITRVWVEVHADDNDARDVIVQMDDGTMYTALFVTLNYLRRQMELTYELSKQIPDALPVRYTALETSHVVVESLDRDTIEDTIDNLIALEVFEGVFTCVTDSETDTTTGTRATQEVAAVVLNEVLVVEE